MEKVPVSEQAKSFRYYKYYETMEIAGLTKEQAAYVAQCKGSQEEALSIYERNKLLEAGSTYPAKTGFYPLKEGGLLVAGNVPMPDCTPEMLYWWWAWHGLEPLRYAIWDPEDHFDVSLNQTGRERALDPNVPLEEKAWDATHTVQESIGGGPRMRL